jgi:mRNA-degrading endonuclease toxin of MazEF toxin-antitoxin module
MRRGSEEAEGTGLQRGSVVQTEIILTVPKTSVTRRLGRFNGATMSAIDQCIRVSLALT